VGRHDAERGECAEGVEAAEAQALAVGGHDRPAAEPGQHEGQGEGPGDDEKGGHDLINCS
jgi:hypothetical protein